MKTLLSKRVNEKCFFDIIGDGLNISEVKLKLCWIFHNFQKGRHFELTGNLFLPEVIPEVEYTKKVAISISEILTFRSTL